MHKQTYREILNWVYRNKHINKAIADLGALNINGSVKDIIPHAVGFDICDGEGVDVVLTPGEIPLEYLHKYDVLFCVNSLNACPDKQIFIEEFLGLLKQNGILFLIFRVGNCVHSTSKNKYGWGWTRINDVKEVIDILLPYFEIETQKTISLRGSEYKLNNIFDYCIIARKL